ncbi:hypothetical protein [Streptodolium elevatio]|uniref:Lipoprotein n=1 Tax=Streptodolium elevatio TaxID=3157996 RepID=A0ABV3DE72_9ACTN
MPPSGRRLRSATVAAATTLSLACALAACGGGSKGSKKSDYSEVCVHRQSMMRVADNLCLTDRTNVYSWYYIPRKTGKQENAVPSEGSSYTGTGGTFTRPNSGSVTRGGFGGSGGDGSSGGGG